MIQLNELCPMGYGMFLYSPDKFASFLKDEKCRAKKLLTYFDKHKDIFFKVIEKGIALPFYKLSVFYYPIFVSINKDTMVTPEGWEQVYRYEDFYIQVGNSNKLCFAAFDCLEYDKNLIDEQKTEYSAETLDEIPMIIHYIVGFDIPKGNYHFDLFAYKRTNPLDESKNENYGRNYAFGVAFKSSYEIANKNLDKCDNEKTVFDVRYYCNE